MSGGPSENEDRPPPGLDADLTPQRAHRTLSRLWVGLLVWHSLLLGGALLWTGGGPVLDWPRVALGMLVASSVLVVPGFAVAGFFRMQSYKRYWEGAVVKPQGYLMGNLWVLGVLDVSATLSALAVLCSADPRFAIPGVVAMTLEGINRPRISPMLPHGAEGVGKGRDGEGGA
ncbi:MAG: hypothetical protein AAF797_10315 [Planctomycetota bacterium]